MENLIFSQDNSIEPNGAIGVQKCGIVFWQKTGFLRYCNALGFQSIITLVNKKFSPSNIQNLGDTCFVQFDNDDNKIIFLSFVLFIIKYSFLQYSLKQERIFKWILNIEAAYADE